MNLSNFARHQDIDLLVNELRRCNRHFLQSSFVKEIEEFVQDSSQYITVPFQTQLYRARICNFDDCKKLKLRQWGEKYGVKMFTPIGAPVGVNTGAFAGFESKDSGAPPASMCAENRASGKGVRRLYVAENARTAVAEVKPSLQSLVSVAKIDVTYREFKALDLTNHQGDGERDYLRTLIDRLFATPCPSGGDSESYSFTQWFADLVEDFGFEDVRKNGRTALEIRGIRYSSAMDLAGKNMVIFGSPARHPSCDDYDSEDFFGVRVTGTEVYFIDNVWYDIEQLKAERGDVFNLAVGNCQKYSGVAKKLKDSGVDVNTIVNATGLSVDEVLNL